jgi:diheme cytochrome c
LARAGKGTLRVVTLLVVPLALALPGCSRPLPAAESAEAKLYRERCGTTCHGAYSPESMPFPTWEMILPRMEQRIAASSEPPLGADERRAIVDYLRKYAR